jgi:hypothetical protein
MLPATRHELRGDTESPATCAEAALVRHPGASNGMAVPPGTAQASRSTLPPVHPCDEIPSTFVDYPSTVEGNSKASCSACFAETAASAYRIASGTQGLMHGKVRKCCSQLAHSSSDAFHSGINRIATRPPDRLRGCADMGRDDCRRCQLQFEVKRKANHGETFHKSQPPNGATEKQNQSGTLSSSRTHSAPLPERRAVLCERFHEMTSVLPVTRH